MIATRSRRSAGRAGSAWRRVIAAVAVALGLLPQTLSARAIDDPPGTLKLTRSIGDLIDRSADKPLHIVFVHGIRAERAGASAGLTDALAADLARLGGPVVRSEATILLAAGPWPEAARVDNVPVWSEPEWAANQPFVVRTRLAARNGQRIVVDELNWWPLVFPIKCRGLLAPEHDLSGDDRAHLRLCATENAVERHHAWLDPALVEERLRERPRSGGGALLNRKLKHAIMNWGLSDAVIAIGPMRRYLNRTVDEAFAHVRKDAAPNTRLVVMTESLGSFIVLDASRGVEGAAVRATLDESYDLYFLANQVALLDLARLEVPTDGHESALDRTTGSGPMDVLRSWADARSLAIDGPKQIVAFSDPSDLLTYRVPHIANVIVANVYVRNSWWLFGLAANPVEAHTGHLRNKDVLAVLLRRTDKDRSRHRKNGAAGED